MYRLMAGEGIGVDVAGAGELAMALAGGVDPARIVMHGNAKTTAELRLAVDAGAGLIVIDNTDDIDRLEELVTAGQPVLLRVLPGVRPDTYDAVATGQAGAKFGLPLPAARAAIDRLRAAASCGWTACTCTSARRSCPPSLHPRGRGRRRAGRVRHLQPGRRAGGPVHLRGRPAQPGGVDRRAGGRGPALLPPGARLIIEPGRSLVALSG